MDALNHTLFLWLNLGWQAAPGWINFARFLSESLIPYLLVSTAAVAFMGRPAWRTAAWQALAAVVLASLAAYALKHAFSLPRPAALGLGVQWGKHSGGAGFPSSHAATVAAWAALAATGTRRWSVRSLFVLAAIAIGWSRVAVGAHFPADVVAGWATGCGCGWVAFQLVRLGTSYRARTVGAHMRAPQSGSPR